jgi:thiol-disulfide isomerase/thioredoxin
MNRKIALLSMGAILIGLVIINITATRNRKEKALMEKTRAELTELPNFSFQDLNGNSFTQADLQTGKPLLVIHFGNFCHYCHKEARIISHYFEEYRNYQLLFVTKDEEPNITAFMTKNKLTNKSNITVLRYQDNEFEEAFGSKSLPCVFIFDKQFQLVQHFDGAVTTPTLVKYTRVAKDR